MGKLAWESQDKGHTGFWCRVRTRGGVILRSRRRNSVLFLQNLRYQTAIPGGLQVQ